jgi:hypothetical protein
MRSRPSDHPNAAGTFAICGAESSAQKRTKNKRGSSESSRTRWLHGKGVYLLPENGHFARRSINQLCTDMLDICLYEAEFCDFRN